MLAQIGDLSANHAGDDVGHPVVVADFLVLIPGRGLAALGAPFANLIGVLLGIRNEQSSGGACDDLVAVEPPVTREENPNILWLINRQSTTSSIISSLLTTFFSDQGRRAVTEQKNGTKKQHTLYFGVLSAGYTFFDYFFVLWLYVTSREGNVTTKER